LAFPRSHVFYPRNYAPPVALRRQKPLV
jgi:hypothetical protein